MLHVVILALGAATLAEATAAQPLPPSRVEAWRRVRILSRRAIAPRVRARPAPPRRRAQTASSARTDSAAPEARTIGRPLTWQPAPRRRSLRILRPRARASAAGSLVPARPAPRPSSLTTRPSTGGDAPISGQRIPGVRARPGPSIHLSGAACLAALRQTGVPFRRARPHRGVTTPVIVTGPIDGVRLTPMWGPRPALMDCRFALTLYRLAPLIRVVGFDELRYSAFYNYRNVAGTHRLSRHANGMAVDIHEFRGPGGLRAHVERDYPKHPGRPGACVGRVGSDPGRRLRRLACALEASGLLYLVLTPDSNYAHRNHFHLSGLRPGNHPLPHRYAGRHVYR